MRMPWFYKRFCCAKFPSTTITVKPTIETDYQADSKPESSKITQEAQLPGEFPPTPEPCNFLYPGGDDPKAFSDKPITNSSKFVFTSRSEDNTIHNLSDGKNRLVYDGRKSEGDSHMTIPSRNKKSREKPIITSPIKLTLQERSWPKKNLLPPIIRCNAWENNKTEIDKLLNAGKQRSSKWNCFKSTKRFLQGNKNKVKIINKQQANGKKKNTSINEPASSLD